MAYELKPFQFPVSADFVINQDGIVSTEYHYVEIDTPEKMQILGETFQEVAESRKRTETALTGSG